MNLKLLADSLTMHGIRAKFINVSLVEINGISVYVRDGLASFGTARFRHNNDIFEFLYNLNGEGLTDISEADKHAIQSDYRRLLNRNV